MKIKPLHNQVAIKQQDEAEKMHGNIIVPDTGKEKAMIGEVIAVGPGSLTPDLKIVPISVKVGDIVTFPSFGGTRINVNGEDVLIYRDSDLLAIIEE